MKKKQRQFYEANMFHLHKMWALAKREGLSRIQMEKGMNQLWEEMGRPTERVEHDIRIDIARNVLKICEGIQQKECMDTEEYIEKLEKEHFEYKQKWVAATILSGALFLLIMAMKIMEIYK